MRVAAMLLSVLPALVGCNALTGVNDLEPVDCVDCVDSAVATDSAVADTTPRDTAVADTRVDSLEPAVDTGVDADKSCSTDRECDDGDACTKDFCSGLLTCKSTVVDIDGDGESPSALGACGLDCQDTNKNVFSTQTEFFTVAYLSTTGTLSFDYNCDGNLEQQYTDVYKCALVGTSCMLVSAGWVSGVPACGRSAKWASNCVKLLSTCVPSQSDRVQGCR